MTPEARIEAPAATAPETDQGDEHVHRLFAPKDRVTRDDEHMTGSMSLETYELTRLAHVGGSHPHHEWRGRARRPPSTAPPPGATMPPLPNSENARVHGSPVTFRHRDLRSSLYARTREERDVDGSVDDV